MSPKRKAPAEALSVMKRARSRSRGPPNNGSTPAAAMKTTSTKTTAVVAATTSPVTKDTEIRTSYNKNTLEGLADVAVTDHVILSVVSSMLNYAIGQEELVREFKMAMDELLRSYLTKD